MNNLQSHNCEEEDVEEVEEVEEVEIEKRYKPESQLID